MKCFNNPRSRTGKGEVPFFVPQTRVFETHDELFAVRAERQTSRSESGSLLVSRSGTKGGACTFPASQDVVPARGVGVPAGVPGGLRGGQQGPAAAGAGRLVARRLLLLLRLLLLPPVQRQHAAPAAGHPGHLPGGDDQTLNRSFTRGSWNGVRGTNAYFALSILFPGFGRAPLVKVRLVEFLPCRRRIGDSSRFARQHLHHAEDVAPRDHCRELLTISRILWHRTSCHLIRWSYFPELFRGHLPFHVMFLPVDEPLVLLGQVLAFIKQSE